MAPVSKLPLTNADATIYDSMSYTGSRPSAAHPVSPRIGIPWRTTQEEERNITGKLQYYFAAAKNAHGEPVPISLKLSPAGLAAKLAELDAFVLPGGPADVNPALYHAPRHNKTHESDKNRENTDFAIVEHALGAGKPLLAICYGCQSLNVCLGGSLFQDIPSQLHTDIVHSRDGMPPGAPDPVHPARIQPGGEIARLAAAAGLEGVRDGFAVTINSSHHQSVRDLGRGVRMTAVAPDGVIEAIEHEPHNHWVVGVQWHPERMVGHSLSASLFRALVEATHATTARR
jgi:putative glutamine amidotransferase